MFNKNKKTVTESKEHYIIAEYKNYTTSLTGNEKTYIENRLINQIIWYDDSAIIKQNKYKHWTAASIVLTAIIPVISLYTSIFGIIASTLIAVLSGASSAILSIINLCEYQKLWIEYRSNCEILKSILHRYFLKVGEFASDNPEENLRLLISTSEEYMLKEFQTWTELSQPNKKEQ